MMMVVVVVMVPTTCVRSKVSLLIRRAMLRRLTMVALLWRVTVLVAVLGDSEKLRCLLC